ncbi:uncharacterized protein N7479_001728 [Penicillium vulpinum]|uniref:uncharacterized protein n=1 Tax=Penicillium vulpinum TaxID=29845 RepID=UPI00254851A7|nr:uncharacterized protein N7479_001728 [Penicillium vulpinum]KAJ5971810.1 hypothetical protein N7479_001728 [Penicillium vulpinum]
MSLPNSDEILQKTLEHVEHTVVEELKTWLDANPHAEWKQSPRFKLVEQCSEIKLREILQQLAQNSSVATFRTSHSGWEVKEGELIPISYSEGCIIRYGDRTYPLANGTKMCISKKVRVEIPEGSVLYLVWKVKNSSH